VALFSTKIKYFGYNQINHMNTCIKNKWLTLYKNPNQMVKIIIIYAKFITKFNQNYFNGFYEI